MTKKQLYQENEDLKDVLRAIVKERKGELKGDYIARIRRLAKNALKD